MSERLHPLAITDLFSFFKISEYTTMSDLIFNLRILAWHFQIERNFRPKISRNDYHPNNGWPDGKWKLYQVGAWHA